MTTQTHQIGQLHAIEDNGTLHIQLPPPSGNARRLWNSLRSRLTQTAPPEAIPLRVDGRHLHLPDQAVPLENVHDISTQNDLTIQFGTPPQTAQLKTGLGKQEAAWLRATLKSRVARRRAILLTLKQLGRS